MKRSLMAFIPPVSIFLLFSIVAPASDYCTPQCFCSADPVFIQPDTRSVSLALLMRLCPKELRDEGVKTINIFVGDGESGAAVFVTPSGKQASATLTAQLYHMFQSENKTRAEQP